MDEALCCLEPLHNGFSKLNQSNAKLMGPGKSAEAEFSSIYIPQTARSWPLANLSLSVRLGNVLHRMDCKLLGDLHGKTYAQVNNTYACGRKTIVELQHLISRLHADELQLNEVETIQPKTLQPVSGTVFIPQNARGWLLAQLPLSTRLAGVCEKNRFILLGDLHGLSYQELRQARNCGRQTLQELEALVRLVQSGEFDQPMGADEEFDLTYLIISINDAIGRLPTREREILLLRFGGTDRGLLTLEEVGAEFNLTRERIRQIANKILLQLQRSSGPLIARLLNKLAERCLKDIQPLTPALLTHWLGTESSVCRFPPVFYTRLFGELEPEIPAWPEGQKLGTPDSERAAVIVRELRGQLRSQTASIPLFEAFDKLKNVARLRGLEPGEFLEALRQMRVLQVDWSQPDLPTVRIRRFKMREWVQLVLSQAAAPLTPEEIIERAQAMLGASFVPPNPFTVGNHLKPEDGFYLLDRRAFGLRQHFRLPQRLWPKVRNDFQQLLQNENRSISTAELINRKRFEWAALTNASELAQILREDSRFADLGRFHFALVEWGLEERERINDLIPKVLQQAGHPLSTSAVVEQLQRFRSVTPEGMGAWLRRHPAVRDYGFGYFGLKSWGNDVKDFLVAETQLINRIVSRSEPPFTFGDLCQVLALPPEGAHADRLWETLGSLPRITRQPNQQSPTTALKHKNWSLERALCAILAEAAQPLPVYEIQWELNDRFGQAFNDRPRSEIERCLRQNRLFTCNVEGEYLLASQLEESGFDLAAIRQACWQLLSPTNEILGCDDLLEQLAAEGIAVDNWSANMIAALLRDDESFEEIGTNRFRASR